MKTYYVNGDFVPADQAVIPVTDLSVLRGYGVCDIMRTYKGKPYFLTEHITRLQNSAKEIGLTLPWTETDIVKMVLTTLKKNKPIDEVNIRIVITAGSSKDFFTPQGEPRLIILITDIKKLPNSWYKNGVKVITHALERPLPAAKITSYIPAALALKKAHKTDAIEAIYINTKQQALEGTTSNLFAFFKNTLVTPHDGVLKGITRQAILSISKQFYQIEKRVIILEELLSADEVFISGTNKGIVPVIAIDNTIVGNGMPGKNTKQLISQFQKHADFFIEESLQNNLI